MRTFDFHFRGIETFLYKICFMSVRISKIKKILNLLLNLNELNILINIKQLLFFNDNSSHLTFNIFYNDFGAQTVFYFKIDGLF